ncbi:MAG: phytanoyl-CoA dioxygenase family protein [Blastocatellia bacterium]
MLQVGIFTGYFPYALEESAKRIRDLGFNTVQLDLIFKDLDLSTENINKQNCIKIRDTFRRHNLPVSCISSYTNLVDPNPAKRKPNLDRLKKIIRHAHDLGSPYVPSETGTYHTESDWLPHPKNKTEEGYEECRAVIQDLVNHARDHGVTFVIEPYVNGCLQVLKGSHLMGRLEHVLTGDQAGADMERVAEASKRLELVYCEMEPGDAMFFHCNLLHRSDQNRSDKPRWSLICCYNAARNDHRDTGFAGSAARLAAHGGFLALV